MGRYAWGGGYVGGEDDNQFRKVQCRGVGRWLGTKDVNVGSMRDAGGGVEGKSSAN